MTPHPKPSGTPAEAQIPTASTNDRDTAGWLKLGFGPLIQSPVHPDRSLRFAATEAFVTKAVTQNGAPIIDQDCAL